MAATITTSRDFDVQVLEETVRGHFAGKNALMGSILASQGAVMVRDSLTADRDFIGTEVMMPYFGTVGEFEDNPEDNAVIPKPLRTTHEKATVARSSLAFEVSKWARHSGPSDADPYEELARQTEESAIRRMDALCVASAAGTPLVLDIFSGSGSPSYLEYDPMVDAQALLGDEDSDIVAMVTHSRAKADLRKLRDFNGRPLLLESMKQGEITTFAGVPLIISDRVPVTGSSMGTVTEAGASVGNVTLSGTPLGAWDLRIDILTGGSRGTATFRFSTDGGKTWSAALTTAANVDLIDTAADSVVGVNGRTGLTAIFGVATYDALSVYSSKAILAVTSLLMQRGAMAFWYNRSAMSLETDKLILKHHELGAMHMYHAVHRYRRRNGGSRPGVVAIKHNVRNFDGT